MPDTMAADGSSSRARFLPCGDTALCVEFGDSIDRQVSARVLALGRRVEGAALPGVVDLVPTFRSLLIHYDPMALSQAQLISQLEPLLAGLDETEMPGRRWHLPACYDPSVALDLEDVPGPVAVRQAVEGPPGVRLGVRRLPRDGSRRRSRDRLRRTTASLRFDPA